MIEFNNFCFSFSYIISHVIKRLELQFHINDNIYNNQKYYYTIQQILKIAREYLLNIAIFCLNLRYCYPKWNYPYYVTYATTTSRLTSRLGRHSNVSLQIQLHTSAYPVTRVKQQPVTKLNYQLIERRYQFLDNEELCWVC